MSSLVDEIEQPRRPAVWSIDRAEDFDGGGRWLLLASSRDSSTSVAIFSSFVPRHLVVISVIGDRWGARRRSAATLAAELFGALSVSWVDVRSRLDDEHAWIEIAGPDAWAVVRRTFGGCVGEARGAR